MRLCADGMNLLHGPIWNKLLRFALPVAATAILEQLFNASDVAVAGKFTGAAQRTAAVAAVGTNSAVIGLIVNLFIGIALGANVVIAHAVGRGDQHEVQKAVHTSVLVAVFGIVLVALLGEGIAAPLLGLLHVPEEAFPMALFYLRIYLAGMPVILLYNFEAAIFRSIGETRIPLLALTASGVLNVLLNLFFVAVLRMTVDGVAVATVISNAVSAALLYYRLRRTAQVIRLDPKQMRIDREILCRILRIGLPAGVQSAVFALSNIVVQAAINSLGTVVMAVPVAVILFFGKSLLAIFNSDPQVIETGYIRLVMIMLAHSMSLLYEVMSGYLRGFGISLAPALLTMVGVCGVRIAWIQFVFPKSRTFQTIMTAYPVSLFLTALLYCRPSRRRFPQATNTEED